MQSFFGKSVYKGIVLGPVVVLNHTDFQVRRKKIEDVDLEKQRVKQAGEQAEEFGIGVGRHGTVHHCTKALQEIPRTYIGIGYGLTPTLGITYRLSPLVLRPVVIEAGICKRRRRRDDILHPGRFGCGIKGSELLLCDALLSTCGHRQHEGCHHQYISLHFPSFLFFICFSD